MRAKHFALLFVTLALSATGQAGKPVIKVAADGFPTGHDVPEGPACDIVRAFIARDVALFKSASIQPFGEMVSRSEYEKHLNATESSLRRSRKSKSPSPSDIKHIDTCSAAYRRTRPGGFTKEFMALKFRDLRTVDVGFSRRNGQKMLERTLVIQDRDGKWYADLYPGTSVLLSSGLEFEAPLFKDFRQAYTVIK